jgi:outer membrane translocation and assembly module TamA
MLLNNLEFRWQFYESFSVLTFLDVGGVYLRDESVAADELRRSTGFGFRYLSPVGPIGFDVGFPLERRPDEPSARFHFSVGTLF